MSIEKTPQPRKLRRTTIKEEIVALTGDPIDAALLNYFIKCQAQATSAEKMIEEERARFATIGIDLNLPPTHGWFYKKAVEASEETMLKLSPSNMRARITKLVVAGWVYERDNPYHKWDKVKQYRVNLRGISEALEATGYHLDGYLIDRVSKTETRISETENREIETESRTLRNETALPSTSTTRANKTSNQQQDAAVPAADSSLSLLDEEEAASLTQALISLRVARDDAAMLVKRYPDECRRRVPWWQARDKSKVRSLGASVRSSIEHPEKWPIEDATAPQSTPTTKDTPPLLTEAQKAARAQQRRERHAAAYEAVWQSLNASYRETVEREGQDWQKHVEDKLPDELALEIRRQNSKGA